VSTADKYQKVFLECFPVPQEKLNSNFTYQSIPEWDSVGHMALMAALEEAFDIVLDIDDIIEFGSYTLGMEILKKYDVRF
tara:strand:+ start:1580 stop:1819 length:240 start_codon:yes stop_codon:yes gene_type:complete